MEKVNRGIMVQANREMRIIQAANHRFQRKKIIVFELVQKNKGLNGVAPPTVKWENDEGVVAFEDKLFSKEW